MILFTSNASKRREFERFNIPGLVIREGEDLREIVSTPEDIIVYKALEAGEGRIVEDAIVVVAGVPIIDVKWQIDAILKGKYPVGTKIDWQVRLGILRNGRVDTFFGVTEGTICEATEDGFGIDPVVLVDGIGKSMARLDKEGTKDPISARRLAIENLVNGNVAFSVNVEDVPVWTGAYQND
jgi:inosine/xanthosine triphosphate pyrophosphatase family protein